MSYASLTFLLSSMTLREQIQAAADAYCNVPQEYQCGLLFTNVPPEEIPEGFVAYSSAGSRKRYVDKRGYALYLHSTETPKNVTITIPTEQLDKAKKMLNAADIPYTE